jgi:uncharacterized membrane protein YphA (DoxX/SURF4 family)
MSKLGSLVDGNHDLAWGCLRVYLGFALVLKGFMYISQPAELTALMVSSHVPLASFGLAKVAALAHVAGGLLLAFGVMTRVAAAIQIPNVIGAIVFVHAKEGLFSANQTLELALLVLFLLVLFAATGGGSWSTEWYFREHPEIEGETVRAK